MPLPEKQPECAFHKMGVRQLDEIQVARVQVASSLLHWEDGRDLEVRSVPAPAMRSVAPKTDSNRSPSPIPTPRREIAQRHAPAS